MPSALAIGSPLEWVDPAMEPPVPADSPAKTPFKKVKVNLYHGLCDSHGKGAPRVHVLHLSPGSLHLYGGVGRLRAAG